MDKVQPITRRAALVGALVSSTLIAVPVAQALAPETAATDRVDDLARKLSALLTETYGGDFECRIGPDGEVSYLWAAMPAVQRFEHHFEGMVDALDEMTADADGWMLHAGRDHERAVWRNIKRSYLVNEDVGRGLVVPVRRTASLEGSKP